MFPEKAEIIDLLCAEGTHYDYVTKYSEYDKRRENITREKNPLKL